MMQAPMIRALAARVAPRLLWRYRARAWPIDTGEPEAVLLPRLAARSKLSIDVGAAAGSYTALLVPLSRRVIAFEPVPQFAEMLRKKFTGTSIVQIEQAALSDRSSSRNLRVPKDCFWRATLENANQLRYSADVTTVPVTVRALDEYSLHDVGFIKIDVEGHELAVLHGASDTIARERPNILIELAEQVRPGAVADACGFFRDADYRGFFLVAGKLESIAAFDPLIHQNHTNLDSRGRITGPYISNFVFLPADHRLSARSKRPELGVTDRRRASPSPGMRLTPLELLRRQLVGRTAASDWRAGHAALRALAAAGQLG